MTSQKNTAYGSSLSRKLNGLGFHRGYIFTIIIFAALFAFETFNYSTTQFALTDLLGNLTFASLSWATILSIAFCGIDFAGIARLFTSDRGSKEMTEVWYLFGAWLLAATMNAILTWWAVSLAIEDHVLQSTSVMSQSLLIKAVPIFVAVMVWLIRILIIGSLSMAGDRLFNRAEQRMSKGFSESIRAYSPQQESVRTFVPPVNTPRANIPATSFQPIHRASIRQESFPQRQPPLERNVEPAYSRPDLDSIQQESVVERPEPVYQPISASPRRASQVRKM